MATANVNLSNYDKASLPHAAGFRVSIVCSTWNQSITDGLLKGCVDALEDIGVAADSIEVRRVPGSFELIYGCKHAQRSSVKGEGKPHVVIAIGSLIRGETAHFDYVAQGVTQGMVELNLNDHCPVVYCVLTDNTMEQSIARSGGAHGNKGVEAAVTAIHMAQLFTERAY